MKITLSHSENKCLTDSFEKQGIKSELLKKCLSAYYNGMHQIILDLMLIQTEIGSISKSTTEFSEHLDEAKNTHEQILNDVISETIENASRVSSAPGAVGLLFGVIKSSYEAATKIEELESSLVKYVTDSEKSALEKKIQYLAELKLRAVSTMKLMKESFELLIASIGAASKDSQEIVAAQELGLKLNIKANNIGLELVEKIDTHMKKIKDFASKQHVNVENQLPIHMISAYIPRGTFSASSLHLPRRIISTIAHSRRKRSIKSHYRHNVGIRLQHQEVTLSGKQSKYLTAILKRFPDSDYDPSSHEYLPLLTRIKRGITLVSKDDRNLNEDIELHTPLFLCQIDKAAYKSDSLYYLLNVRRCFFQSYPYGADKHLAYKDTLLHAYNLAAKHKDASSSFITEIHVLSTSILRYYVNALLAKYLSLPTVSYALSNKSISLNDILETVTRVINNELSDDTPSLYYRSPMAGLSLFLSAVKASDKIKDAIKLSINDGEIEISFASQLCLKSEGITLTLPINTPKLTTSQALESISSFQATLN